MGLMVDVERLVKAIVAISCLTALEITALIKGIDGSCLVPVAMAIAALGGYIVSKKYTNNSEAK